MLAPLKLKHFRLLQTAASGGFGNFGFTADRATITPSITLSSGTANWLVVEGDGSQFTYNTATFLHTRTDPGAMTVILRNTAALASKITKIECPSDGITAMNGRAGTLAYYRNFKNLTTLTLYSNSSLTITGALADLPASMTHLILYNTTSTITGSMADLPASMTQLYLYNTTSTITGALADLPASMTHLYLYNTTSTITGADTGAPAATGLRTFQIQSATYTAAQLDTLLLYIFTYRANWTYATPNLNIGGTNPDPNGIYQDAAPPTTGLEYAFKLVNDPDAEGFNTWTITY